MDSEDNKPAATPAGATPVMDIQPPQPTTPTANPVSTEPLVGGPAVDPAAAPTPAPEPTFDASPAPAPAATPAPIAEALSGTEPIDAPADMPSAAPSSVITPNMGGDAAPTPGATHTPEPGKAKPPKKHGAPVAAVVVAIIIALGLIGVAVYAYMKSHKHTTAPATTAAPATPAAVTASDVDKTTTAVDTNLQKTDDTKDFPTADLSDPSLSLQ